MYLNTIFATKVYTQSLMAILSTINVKKNPNSQFQECVRLTSTYFLHLAFSYCTLGVFRYRHIIKLFFICPVLIIFFMVVKYSIDYWSAACFWMHLSSHRSYEEIKYTHSHFTDLELRPRKKKQLAEGSCMWKSKDLKNQTHSSLQGFVLFIVLKPEFLP